MYQDYILQKMRIFLVLIALISKSKKNQSNGFETVVSFETTKSN